MAAILSWPQCVVSLHNPYQMPVFAIIPQGRQNTVSILRVYYQRCKTYIKQPLSALILKALIENPFRYDRTCQVPVGVINSLRPSDAYVCVSKSTIIGSDNGLSPGRRQAIIWTSAGILLIRSLGTHFNEMLIEILIFSFMKMRLKVSSAKWRPFCLGLNVLSAYSMTCCAHDQTCQRFWYFMNGAGVGVGVGVNSNSGVGVGFETSGVGVDNQETCRSWSLCLKCCCTVGPKPIKMAWADNIILA